MPYKFATEAEASYYIQIAKDWVDTTHHWNDSKHSAISAIAEYLANQEGVTLYSLKKE